MSYQYYAFTFVGYCTDGDYICLLENDEGLEIGDKIIENFEIGNLGTYQMDGHEFFIDWQENSRQCWCVGLLLSDNDKKISSYTLDEMVNNFEKAKAILDYLGIPVEPKLYTFLRLRYVK